MLLKAEMIKLDMKLGDLPVDLTVSGKITRVWDRKSGIGDYGPWSFQNIVVADDTGEMQVLLKNRKDELSSKDVDKTITLKCKETSKGIMGVKVEKESYTKDDKPVEVMKVVVTPSGIIELSGGTSSAPAEEAEEAPAQASAPKTAVDLNQLRKDTIKTTYEAWMETVELDKMPIDSPAYAAAIAAIIRVSGPNADTLFISKVGGRGK